MRSIAIFEEIGNEVELAHSLKTYSEFLLKAQDLGEGDKVAEEAKAINDRALAIYARIAAQPRPRS